MKPINAEVVLDNLLSHMLGHIYWKDMKGVYLGCNDKQARSLGLQEGKEVVGKTDFELWPVEVARRFSENDSVCNRDRPPQSDRRAGQDRWKTRYHAELKGTYERFSWSDHRGIGYFH